MNRRTALMLSMFLGGLIPRGLWAQTAGASRQSRATRPSAGVAHRRPRRSGRHGRRARGPVRSRARLSMAAISILPATPKSPASQPNPQKAIIDWIFKRTGMTDWHGDKVAVLSASRSELRAYNSPEILKQVDEVVERFTNATEDVLSVHVQFIAAVDTRWRYSALSRADLRRQRSAGAADLDQR